MPPNPSIIALAAAAVTPIQARWRRVASPFSGNNGETGQKHSFFG
jgi:hypothetical protein